MVSLSRMSHTKMAFREFHFKMRKQSVTFARWDFAWVCTYNQFQLLVDARSPMGKNFFGFLDVDTTNALTAGRCNIAGFCVYLQTCPEPGITLSDKNEDFLKLQFSDATGNNRELVLLAGDAAKFRAPNKYAESEKIAAFHGKIKNSVGLVTVLVEWKTGEMTWEGRQVLVDSAWTLLYVYEAHFRKALGAISNFKEDVLHMYTMRF